MKPPPNKHAKARIDAMLRAFGEEVDRAYRDAYGRKDWTPAEAPPLGFNVEGPPPTLTG